MPHFNPYNVNIWYEYIDDRKCIECQPRAHWLSARKMSANFCYYMQLLPGDKNYYLLRNGENINIFMKSYNFETRIESKLKQQEFGFIFSYHVFEYGN